MSSGSNKMTVLVATVLLTTSILFLLSPLWATPKANTEAVGSGAMLRTGVDARALGMGGAFVAIADTYSAGHWNPAGITKTNSIYLGGMNLDKYGLGLNYNYLSLGTPAFNLPFGGNSSSMTLSSFLPKNIAFSATYSGFSTEVQAYTGGSNPQPVGKIVYSERLFKGVLGTTIPKLGSVGFSLKNYRFRAPNAGKDGQDATANGLGFDLGFLAQPLDNLSVGAAGFDLTGSLQLGGDLEAAGTKIRWKNTPTEPTNVAPSRYSAGAAYSLNFDSLPLPEWFSGNALIAGQYTFGPNIPNKIKAGLEYNLSIFSLRVGAVKPVKSDLYFTAGAGLDINMISFDVAWVQNKVFDSSNTSDTIVISSEFTF